MKASRHLTEYNEKETAFRHYQFICQLCNDFLIFDEKENWDRHCNFKGRNQIHGAGPTKITFLLGYFSGQCIPFFFISDKRFWLWIVLQTNKFLKISCIIQLHLLCLQQILVYCWKVCLLSDRSESLFDNRSQIFL